MATYKLIEALGRGGMGVVYRAIQKSLDREVALKLLLPDDSTTDSHVRRFLREVRACTRISHPNIIRVLDYGEIEDRPFYAMEYLKARTLEDVLKQAGSLPIPDVASILNQLLDALSCVHRAGLVHRDLKATNAMIDEGGHVTLMDFGLVKDVSRTVLTVEGTILGTPKYLSPEVITGDTVDGRSDQFSLGVLAYLLITNRWPFSGETVRDLAVCVLRKQQAPVRQHRPDCPDWLVGMVDRFLAKKPEDRFSSCTEALNTVRRELGEPEADLSGDSIPIMAESAGSADFDPDAPVPQHTIEGGAAALRAAMEAAAPQETGSARDQPPASLDPGPVPIGTRNPTRTSPRLRTTARIRAVAPVPPAPARRPALIVTGAVCAGALVVLALMWSARGRSPSGPGDRPSVTVALGSPGAGPAAFAGSPAGPGQNPRSGDDARAAGVALLAALERFAPSRIVAQISTDLSRLRPARWFAVPPAADMVALRQTWSDTLTRRLDELRMLPKLTAFAALRQEFFSRSGTFARERLDLYLRLHELTDLRNYCDRFKIPLELDPAGAFWEGYGRLSRATIPDGPGASLCFKVGDHANDPALARVRPGDEEVQIPMGERFHEVADAQEDLDMFGEGRKRALEYTGRKALPLPPLEEVEELEISGLASDLARNSRFVISLGTDRTSFEEMAVVRMVGGQLRPFWHTVERSLLEGSRLFVKVNLRLLPRMDGAHEYAYLPRLTVRCRLRARPPSPAQ